jgi:hypothetical protein
MRISRPLEWAIHMPSSKERGHTARADRLPLTFDGVTAEWFTSVLRHQYPGVTINGLKVLGKVPGHTSKARFALDRNQAAIDAGLPEQICLKGNLTGDPLSSNVCVNEARFYGLLRAKLDLPAPRSYFADWDDDAQGEQGIVMLEDLIPLGGTFGTSGQHVSMDDMAGSLEQLARLHGMTWDLPELGRHDWLLTAMSPDTPTDDYWTLMKDYVGAHNAKAEHLELFPPWVRDDPNRLHAAFLELCEQEMRDRSPLCLVHGDAHLGNSYRRPDGHRMWFDWQIVRKGRPWRDVTYFLVGSLDVEQRRASERDLVRHYCEQLARHSVKLNVDKAWDDYRRWVLWGVIAWHLNINPNENTLSSLNRFCRAAEDLDTKSFFGF